MSHELPTGQSHQPRQHHTAKNTNSASLVAVLLAALPMFALFGASTALSGCGFQLRGYETPMRLNVTKTAVIIADNRTAFGLKLPLTRRLSALGVEVISNMSTAEVAHNNQTRTDPIAAISIDNLRFKRYELVGVLTETRLVLSADVSYQTIENGAPVTLSTPIQVERSYQYNEASVSTHDQQGEQVREWLYDSLARRITDQYLAISLPKVHPDDIKQPVDQGIGAASTAIIAPTP